MLGEDALRERVQCADRGPVQHRERVTAGHASLAGAALELAADAVHQFAGGLLGERDRRDVVCRHTGLDERNEPVHET